MNQMLGIITANFTDWGLGSLTDVRTAASLPIAGRYRLVDFTLSAMVNSAVNTVGLIVPSQYRSLLDHVGVGKAWNLNRKSGGLFILPGSAYGIRSNTTKFLLRDLIENRAILDRESSELVLVCAADWVYNVDFREMAELHLASGADVTLLCKKRFTPGREHRLYLRADESGRVTGMGAEGNRCFMDAFIISRALLLQFLDWYAAVDYYDLVADAFEENLGKMMVSSYTVSGYAEQVQTPEDYIRVNMDFLKSHVRREILKSDRAVLTKIQDNPPSRYIESGTVENALIPSGCVIAGSVADSVLFRGVVIEPGAVVRGCVLMSNTHVGKNAVLENVICDKEVTVGDGVHLTGSAEKPLILSKKQVI